MIRRAILDDFNIITGIYSHARQFMSNTGNPNQWGSTNYPSDELITSWINDGTLYVIDDNGIKGVFYMKYGIDPLYTKGTWLNDEDYAAIHVVASAPGAHGILKMAIEYTLSKYKNIRMDTHKDNKVMQAALLKNNMAYCGMIEVNDGDLTPRLAYQYKR